MAGVWLNVRLESLRVRERLLNASRDRCKRSPGSDQAVSTAVDRILPTGNDLDRTSECAHGRRSAGKGEDLSHRDGLLCHLSEDANGDVERAGVL